MYTGSWLPSIWTLSKIGTTLKGIFSSKRGALSFKSSLNEKRDKYFQISDMNSYTEWQTVQIQISWLLQKPTDLDLHCLQRQSLYRFRRTRVNSHYPSLPTSTIIKYHDLEKCHSFGPRQNFLPSDQFSILKTVKQINIFTYAILKKVNAFDYKTTIANIILELQKKKQTKKLPKKNQ